MRFIFPVLLLIGAGAAVWDATHHDGHGAHGQPITTAQVEQYGTGTYHDDDGEQTVIKALSCRPGEDGHGTSPNVHFRCDVTLGSGETDNVVVHVKAGDELLFKTGKD